METNAVVNPDLQVSGGGHSHPDPVIRGGPGLKKKFVLPGLSLV